MKNTGIYAHPERRDLKEIILRIENEVHIGNCNIIGVRKIIVLEGNVMLGPRGILVDYSHYYEDMEIPIKLQAVTEGGPVRLEKDW